jgi:hypothetical protein
MPRPYMLLLDERIYYLVKELQAHIDFDHRGSGLCRIAPPLTHYTEKQDAATLALRVHKCPELSCAFHEAGLRAAWHLRDHIRKIHPDEMQSME